MKIPKIDYRKDIDGLRSISVLFVIFYHLYPNIFNGGFLGVDIFFVISGYVITQSLYNSEKKDFFSYIKNFYARRILRIYPLLVLVSLVTILLTLIFFSYSDFDFIFYSFITSIFGISNLYYIKTGRDYFLDEIDNPFLHTWSLGVEEQFYLVYPIILFVLLKKFPLENLKFLFIFLTLIIISKFFSLSQRNNEILSFYFPLTRFWELLSGCLLFFIYKNYKKRILTVKYKDLTVAVALLIIFILLFTAKNLNLSISLIIVVLCVATLILLSNFSLIKIILNNFYVSYVGKISFGLYLWHYPILYFIKGRDEHHILLSFFLITASFLVSILTYEFLKTIRYNKSLRLKLLQTFKYSYVLIILFIVLIFNFNTSKNYFLGIKDNIENFAEKISINIYQKTKKNNSNYSKYLFLGKSAKNCQQADKDKSYFIKNYFKKNDKKNDTLFFLVGDSIITSFLPMFDQFSNEGDIYLSAMSGAFYLPDVSYSTKDIFPENSKIMQTHIKNNIENLNEISKKYKNKFFILGNMYRYYLDETILFSTEEKNKIEKKDYYLNVENKLNKLISRIPNDVNIIIIPQTIVLTATREECFKSKKSYKSNCNLKTKDFHLRSSRALNDVFDKLKNKHGNFYVYDLIDLICPKENCNYFRENYDSYYYDKGHLTVETSVFLASHFKNFLTENNLRNQK